MDVTSVESLRYIAKQVGYGYQGLNRYQAKATFLFKDIPLEGRRVIDIGCGTGTFALWAAVHGAKYVLGIEPESAGGTGGTLERFQSIIADLELEDQVEAKDLLLQDLPVPEERFDVCVMYNVINHLDEEAVAHLHEDWAAVKRYLHILQHLRQIMTANGLLIVADCARSNFWPAVGLKPPLARTIEWKKHQNPKTWIDIFSRVAFHCQDLRWSPIYPLGRFCANRLFQYFTRSHFVLRFRAGKEKVETEAGKFGIIG